MQYFKEIPCVVIHIENIKNKNKKKKEKNILCLEVRE